MTSLRSDDGDFDIPDGDDVLVFISRRDIYIRDGSRGPFHYRSDAYRARLHDSRGRNTVSQHERD